MSQEPKPSADQTAHTPAPEGATVAAAAQALSSPIFHYTPHPRVMERKTRRPPKVNDERVGINGKIGLFITTVVGTMWCAYVFSGLAFVSLRTALSSGDLVTIVSWISQTFLQLVLLPVIIVGQNIQARAADRRADETYKDAEAIMHECIQLQAHLRAQDKVLSDMLSRVQAALPGKA